MSDTPSVLTEAEREDLARAARSTNLAVSDLQLGAIGAACARIIAARVDADRAAAWDEGYRSGLSNAMRRMSDEPNAPTTPNPYRALDSAASQPSQGDTGRECDGCLCPTEHDGGFGSAGHAGPCPPHACSAGREGAGS